MTHSFRVKLNLAAVIIGIAVLSVGLLLSNPAVAQEFYNCCGGGGDPCTWVSDPGHCHGGDCPTPTVCCKDGCISGV